MSPKRHSPPPFLQILLTLTFPSYSLLCHKSYLRIRKADKIVLLPSSYILLTFSEGKKVTKSVFIMVYLVVISDNGFLELRVRRTTGCVALLTRTPRIITCFPSTLKARQVTCTWLTNTAGHITCLGLDTSKTSTTFSNGGKGNLLI